MTDADSLIAFAKTGGPVAACTSEPQDRGFPPHKTGMGQWVTELVGTRHWIVAPRLTSLMIAKGYTVAIPQARFTELAARFQNGEPPCSR